MKRPLATKLAAYTTLVAMLIGLAFAGFAIRSLYERSTTEIIETAEQLVALTLDAAAEAVYQLDNKIAEDLLNGLMRNQLFLQVAIYDDRGEILARMSRERTELTGIATLISIPPTEFRSELPLRNESLRTGKFTALLDVGAGLAPFYEIAFSAILSHLLAALIVSLGVFVFAVFLVTAPVSAIASRLAHIKPGSDSRLTIPKGHQNDELGNLARSANHNLDAASEYLMESARRRKVLLDTLNSLYDSVITVDVDGQISAANNAAHKLFGFGPGEALGRPFNQLLPGHEHSKIEEIVAKGSARGRGQTIEFSGRKQDGHEFPMGVKVRMTELIDGPHSLWTISDNTERNRAEAERLHLEDQLRQSQKMEAIGTLAGGIAHDFNNMLGGIIGFTELAADDIAKDSPAQEHLSRVLSISNKATQLARQILTFSRKRDEKRMPVDLCDVANDCTALIARSVPTNIELVTEFNGPSFVTMADETMMHQVMMNLFTNSAAAIANNRGTISLILDVYDGAIPEGVIQATEQLPKIDNMQAFIRLTIRDDGAGIPADVIHRIFEPFFTLKEIGAGTGMGLAVVHSIVKNHGGWVDVDSSSAGTVFTVFLPRIDNFVADQCDSEDAVTIDGKGNERLLIVDDDEMNTDLLRLALTRCDYQVSIANNGEEAFKIYQAEAQNFDLVITDQTMPGMNGSDLASRIFSVCPDQPIILITGHSQYITEEEALSMGIRRFLMKPLSMSTLSATVRTVLDQAKSE